MGIASVMKLLAHPLFIISFLCLPFLHSEDIVELTNGTKFNGTILQQDDKRILLRFHYGTIGLNRSQIKSISSAPDPEPLPVATAKTDQLPAWSAIIGPLSKQPWARDLTQIPATVIDVGVMKNVPYISFRCSRDYEINIYGDLDNPVCIEAGVYRSLLDDAAAKQNCIDLLKNHVLQNALDRTTITGLNRAGDVATHGKLTLEITPPTAEDAYGGWWVAAYFPDAVDAIRAKDSDLAAITVPKSAPAPASANDDTALAWSNDDLSRSRSAVRNNSSGTAAIPAAPSGGSSSGGRVYVRGYTRKDGTYVQPHTRRR